MCLWSSVLHSLFWAHEPPHFTFTLSKVMISHLPSCIDIPLPLHPSPSTDDLVSHFSGKIEDIMWISSFLPQAASCFMPQPHSSFFPLSGESDPPPLQGWLWSPPPTHSKWSYLSFHSYWSPPLASFLQRRDNVLGYELDHSFPPHCPPANCWMILILTFSFKVEATPVMVFPYTQLLIWREAGSLILAI